jgi:hypothetical protein
MSKKKEVKPVERRTVFVPSPSESIDEFIRWSYDVQTDTLEEIKQYCEDPKVEPEAVSSDHVAYIYKVTVEKVAVGQPTTKRTWKE